MGKPFLQYLYNEPLYFSCRKCKNHIANGKHLHKKSEDKNLTLLNFKKIINVRNVKIKNNTSILHISCRSSLIFCLKCDYKIGVVKSEKPIHIYSIFHRSIIQNNNIN